MKDVSIEKYREVARAALANGAEDKATEGTTICAMQTVMGTVVIAQAVYKKGSKPKYQINDGLFRCKLPDEPRATWSEWLPMADYKADEDCEYEFKERVDDSKPSIESKESQGASMKYPVIFADYIPPSTEVN